MAKRKFLLAIGQSNSTAIGDAQSWEDEYPQIALRSPTKSAPQYSEGSYSDMLTLPHTFPGGSQTERFGTGTKPQAWQTVNCKGRAVQALRMLTFYDPLPTGLNLKLDSAINRKYPGTCAVLAGSTRSTLVLTQRWQSNPNGLTLIRKSTGQPYTITSVAAGNTVTVTPDVLPEPTVNEEFQFTFTAGPNIANASQLRFVNQVGGYNDLGTTFFAGAFLARKLVNPVLDNVTPGSTRNPCRFTILDRPIRIGQPVDVQTETTPSQAVATTTNGSSNIALNINPFAVGNMVYFPITAPTPLQAWVRYFVVFSSGLTIQVADSAGGTPIVMTSGGTYLVNNGIPNGVEQGVTYYISSRGALNEQVFCYANASNQFQTNVPHKLAVSDVVRFNQNYGSTIATGVEYYIVAATALTFQVAINQGGSAISFGAGSPSGFAAIKVESRSHYYLRRPTTSTVASVDTSADTVTLERGHFLSVGDTVRFSSTGNLPGGLSATENYRIASISTPPAYRVLTFINAATQVPVDLTSVGSGVITMTQVGGEELLSCDATQTIGVRLLDQYRGSMTGLTARCVTGTAANVGQTRVLGDVYYDYVNQQSIVEVATAFPATPVQGDTFVIEPPSINSTAVPYHKWAMWLPWSPFEGRAIDKGVQTGTTINLSAIAGGSVLFSPMDLPLFKNTVVQFYGNPNNPLLIDNSNVGSTTQIIEIKYATSQTPGAFQGKWIQFTTGALAGQYRQILTNTPSQIFVTAPFSVAASDNDQFKVLEWFTHPAITIGRNYYVVGVDQSFVSISETYDGPALVSAVDASCIMNMTIVPQEGKSNPFPPGFNYPNHLTPVANGYQPFDGLSLADQPRSAHYISTGLKLYDYVGEVMYVIPFGIGSTGISHREISFGGDSGTGVAWFDPDQQLSWSPGESTNCFARLCDILDAAKLAWEAQGDTGECVGIVWAQGEDDAAYEDTANRYFNNCTKLKAAVRQAIKDRGLYSGNASRIPWIHPKIRTINSYASTINTAIEKMVEADSYSRTFEVQDLDVMPDNIHYAGSGMAVFSERTFDAWLAIQRMGTSEVEICNLALANIGETAKVTSIDPPDGSAQAAICARFYPLARDTLLEMGNWSFAIKRKTLVEVDNPRTEWEYAYEVPGDVGAVLSVLPPGALDDWVMNGQLVPQKFVIETNVYGQKVLYTHQEDADIRYTAKIVDTTLFSNLFVIALSWHLSSMIAGPLIKGEVGAAESKRCAQMATAYMMQASSYDKNTQAEVKPTHTPSWISIR